MDVMKTFGNKIKDLRILQGYSQEELANRAGIDRTYILC
jgi:transcriptional regulator with XRE-family HTH domain